MPNNVYIYCPNFPGVKTHLDHVGSLLRLNKFNVTYLNQKFKLSDIVDNSTVIFGAWVPYYNRLFEVLKKQKTNIKIVVSWCSPLSQMNLENDLYNFLAAAANPYIDRLFLSRDEGETLKKVFPNITFFPAPFIINEKVKRDKKSDGPFIITMFNANTPRKNTFVQLAALKKIDDILLYTNLGDTDYCNMNKNLIKLFNINNINDSWIPTADYNQIIATTDIGMQVTFCEGFNYVLAEHFTNGIPVIVSGANPIIEKNKTIHEHLVVHDIASVNEISSTIEKLRRDSKLITDVGEECRLQLVTYCEKANKRCLEILKEII